MYINKIHNRNTTKMKNMNKINNPLARLIKKEEEETKFQEQERQMTSLHNIHICNCKKLLWKNSIKFSYQEEGTNCYKIQNCNSYCYDLNKMRLPKSYANVTKKIDTIQLWHWKVGLKEVTGLNWKSGAYKNYIDKVSILF